MYEVLIETVTMALMVVSVTGVFASAVMEMVKQVVRATSNWRLQIPAEWMTLLTALISAGSTVYVLVESDVGVVPALMAAVVAVFTPKLAHDIVRRQT